MKMKKIRLFFWLIFPIIVGCGGGEDRIIPGTEKDGILRGQVVFISLPEVRSGYKVPPAFYQARKVIINSTLGKEIRRLDLDEEGGFYTTLRPDKYIVDINRLGVDRTNTPREIVIKPGEVTEIKITVDTGLR